MPSDMPSHSSSGSSAPSFQDDPQPSVALIARQAIVNAQQAVIGYELFNRSRTGPTHTAATDVALVFTALSHAGTEELVGKKLIFVNCTHESLTGGHLELVDPEKVVLEIPPLGHVATEEVTTRLPILMALRERGFHLAFNHTVLQSAYASWLPLADYIKFDLSALAPDQLAVLISYANRHSEADLIAEKVETAQQYDMASSKGIQMFQGYWFARPSVVQAKLVSPSQASILELINLVRKQASTDAIEDVLKKDAGLAFNLMRLINSSGFGLTREITSFRQAVMLMGLKKLFRWAALLLTVSRTGGPPSSVGQTAVVRGRLMELLALETQSREEADEAFVVGIFSLLDAMLGMPMPAALDLLSVPEAVSAALLRREGHLGDLLTLVNACESSDDDAFNRAASNVHLTSQQINGAHLQALAWADHIDG
ncbi:MULTISPECIES: EAL and HDOD domain-containing protein [unclassified Simplicispira]|uniref:EAL and HDOD domain-containing protein n=1 Tax=unclassified Simplicispira TaxID=2630407 RepID=UPI000D5F00A1|nr:MULTISPECIES: HDOD domain-containing protein [unclassified Simplicispira]PVY56134.1 EAL and modified HD-GYP domain-containing signal transduction protein [Simplicispira sp. 125]REG17079.1 EAL and modified HD-GYP domain-containing signal transduction protein [Simplicispira sp. 110]